MTGTHEIEALYRRLLDAWNARDATAMAACFGPGATMIGFDGSTETGPEEMERHLAPIFRDHPTAAYVAVVDEVRELGPGVAVLRASVGMVSPGKDDINPAANAIQCVVARQSGDEWRIELFQNTPAAFHGRPDLADAHSETVRGALRTS